MSRNLIVTILVPFSSSFRLHLIMSHELFNILIIFMAFVLQRNLLVIFVARE